MPGVTLIQSQEPRFSFGSPTWEQEPQAFAGPKQVAGYEARPPGLVLGWVQGEELCHFSSEVGG